jgi:uncharacterized protein (DUF2141 family)
MVRRTLAVSSVLVVALGWVPNPAQAPVPIGELRVEVVDLESDEGAVGLALYDSKRTYLSEPYAAGYVGIRDRQSLWVVEDLPFGEYAVTVYHDRNGNLKLDKNFIRIPKEPYGFSNNPKVRFGPPGFGKVKFVLDQGTKTIRIRIN